MVRTRTDGAVGSGLDRALARNPSPQPDPRQCVASSETVRRQAGGTASENRTTPLGVWGSFLARRAARRRETCGFGLFPSQFVRNPDRGKSNPSGNDCCVAEVVLTKLSDAGRNDRAGGVNPASPGPRTGEGVGRTALFAEGIVGVPSPGLGGLRRRSTAPALQKKD